MADTSERGIGTCDVFFDTSWFFGTVCIKKPFHFSMMLFEEGELLGTNLLSECTQDEGYYSCTSCIIGLLLINGNIPCIC